MTKTATTEKKTKGVRKSNAATVSVVSNGARASLETYNQTPRKVRLVTDLVKGKTVTSALAALEFLPKRAAEPIAKLIKSAAANAKNDGKDVEGLKVQSIVVESAGMMKRYMPRAFGRASAIRRKKSRVKVTLA
ncbi:MAG: 50S ribosomal protein L22 [Minisyncoccia bacterium]